MVLLSHSSNAGIFFHPFLNFQSIGKIGVYLFFVLSAYLLDRQIAITLRSGKSSLKYWKNYSLRRFLRIIPLFTIALITHYMLTVFGITTVIDSPKEVLQHLLLIRGEDIFWSIPVEFKYYIISPLLMYVCHRYLKWRISLIFGFFATLIIFSMLTKLVVDLPVTSTLKFFPVFLVGTAISIYELVKYEAISKVSHSIKLEIAGLISFGIILITIPYYFELIFNKEVNFQSTALSPFYALLWGILLIGAKYGWGLLKWVFEIRFLRFIGTISFSMYLFHMPVLIIVTKYWPNLPPKLSVYIFFAISILISCITFLLIERPLSKIRLK